MAQNMRYAGVVGQDIIRSHSETQNSNGNHGFLQIRAEELHQDSVFGTFLFAVVRIQLIPVLGKHEMETPVCR